jgi:hypothetical protein
MARQGFKLEEAARVATEIGLDFASVDFDVEQFRKGMDVELEHGKRDPDVDVTNDDPLLTGKIAWAHLKERPDYYEVLEVVEQGYEPEESPKTVQFHMTAEKGAQKMSQHPKFIRVQGQLFKLEEEQTEKPLPEKITVKGNLYELVEAPEQPEFIKVGGVVFQKVPAELIEAAKKKPKSKKKDDEKDEKKGKGKKAKPDKKKKLKDDKKDKKEKAKPGKSEGKWSDLPKGWTKKSAESFWNSIGGSVTKCRKKLKDADEIDDTGAFCASLKDKLEGPEWRKEKKKKGKGKGKKASAEPPRTIRINGQLYNLDD